MSPWYTGRIRVQSPFKNRWVLFWAGFVFFSLLYWIISSKHSIGLCEQKMMTERSFNVIECLAWCAETGSRVSSLVTSTHLLPYHFIACSSDDWGRIADSVPLFRSKKARQNFLKATQYELVRSLHRSAWSLATIETARDMQRLHQFLSRLQSAAGEPRQRFILSPMWITGGPDIPAMQYQLGIVPTRTHEPIPYGDTERLRLPSSVTAVPWASLQEEMPPTFLRKRWLDSSQHLPDTCHRFNPEAMCGIASCPSGPSSGEKTPLASPFIRSALSPKYPRAITRYTARNRSARSNIFRHDLKPGLSLAYREVLLSRIARNGASLLPGRSLIEAFELAEWFWRLWFDRLWSPQFHGGAHIHPQRWIEALSIAHRDHHQTDSDAFVSYKCLLAGYICGENFTALRSEFAAGAWSPEQIQQRTDAFAAFWGYRPRIMSSPHNTWTPALIEYLRDARIFFGIDAGSRQCARLGLTNDSQRPVSCMDREPFDTFGSFGDHRPTLRFRVLRRLLRARAGFTVIAWHAQNALSSTDSEQHASVRLEHLGEIVQFAQRQNHTVFVTNSELHQLRLRGWSCEIWSDALVFRNFLRHDILVPVPCLEDIFAEARPWRQALLRISRPGHGIPRSRSLQGLQTHIRCIPWAAGNSRTTTRRLERDARRFIRQIMGAKAIREDVARNRRLSDLLVNEGFLFLPSDSHWVEIQRPWYE